MTAKVGNPSLLVAACIVLPQIIVALASPSVGRLAEKRGRRIVLMIGFCMLPLRGLIFATSTNPTLVVAVQALDGIGGACFGIMVPADRQRRCGGAPVISIYRSVSSDSPSASAPL